MEEVAQIHRRLSKFLKGEKSNVQEMGDVLTHLETVHMTYSILKETKIGQTVAKLRKHETELLAGKAKILVKKWKALAMSPRPSASDISQSSTPTSTPATTPKKSHSIAHSTGVKKTTTVSSKVNFIPTGLSKVRAVVREKLKEILDVSHGDVEGDSAAAATDIEVAMAGEYRMDLPGENKKEYTGKFRQLSFNLKKNASLREDLLQRNVSGESLIKMSPEELATEEKRKEIEKLRDDAFQRSRLDWAEANAEKINKQCGIENDIGLFTCGKCKSTKTSNTQKQTRSADEPMTVFVVCHNCGARWKC